jgi:hypothetical protein
MQFKAFAKARGHACALGKSRVRKRSGLDSEDGNCEGRGFRRRVVAVFNPSGDSGARIYQLGSSQPDDRHHSRMERYWLSVQRVIVDARRSLLAATMRRRHFHLAALVFHFAAAGAFPECSFPHWEPCRPSPGPDRTPAAGPAHRIGATPSFAYTEYLKSETRLSPGSVQRATCA